MQEGNVMNENGKQNIKWSFVKKLLLILAGGVLATIVGFLLPKLFPDNEPPIAQITTNDTKGTIPLQIVFNGINSSDPEGKDLKFKWTIDGINVSTESSFSYVFKSPQIYSVALLVIDNKGLKSSNSTIIEALPPPPTPTIIEKPPPTTNSAGSNSPIINFEESKKDKEHSDYVKSGRSERVAKLFVYSAILRPNFEQISSTLKYPFCVGKKQYSKAELSNLLTANEFKKYRGMEVYKTEAFSVAEIRERNPSFLKYHKCISSISLTGDYVAFVYLSKKGKKQNKPIAGFLVRHVGDKPQLIAILDV